jgi:hypothetical protein
MRCFVISPIGQPGSDTRKHADDVFECIIEPALKAAEIEGRRADHINDVGRVTRQMYDDILQADFCVALLHGFNPNVFYELAIAHSAGIPVILLSQLGIDPPFDIKDERVFSYDLSPRAIYHGDNVKRLAGMIDSVRKLGGKREVPFGHNLTPLNAATAALDYVLRTETNAQADEWLKLVRQARKRLYLGGIAFGGWRGIQGMKEGLGECAVSGCEVRIMTMDPQNPGFAIMMNPDISTVGQSTQAEHARAWFREALGSGPNAEVRSIRKGMLFQQIIICDDQMLVSPYLYSANTGFSPRLDIKASWPAAGAFLREFEYLWKLNAPG